MPARDAASGREQLRIEGVVLLPAAFPADVLTDLRRAAEALFAHAESGHAQDFPESYGYNPLSRSVRARALADFGCPGELRAPQSAAGLDELMAAALGCPAACDPQQSWVRKRYAPFHAPAGYYPNRWHQDGGLGVEFPPQAAPAIPMTRLATCWIPLDACAGDRPALEFVRRRLDSLLHFTELDDAGLRRRFSPEEFWAPETQLGDGLVFLNGTLHRTYVHPEMRRNRLSVEYRFFPAVATG